MRKVTSKFSPFHLRSVHRTLAAVLLVTFPFQQALEAAGGPTLPSGGAFTAGSGTIANSANAVTIHQATNRGVIDWRNFSIGAGGSVLFQNGSGATLNRVTGSQMSLILGSLQATGTVYLINPQGVIIGPNGRVKTRGDFVASTLNLPNSLFLSGGALLFDGKSQAFVKNLGAISSTGGSVFLIADRVTNKGTISAPNGSVGMAAGERVLLADSGSDQRIFVSAGTGDVTNKGTVAAAQAELKANDGNIYALAGNTGGEIRATGTANRDGHVWLVSNNGTTQVTGKVAAQNADGNGGSIETSGHTVEIGNTSIKTGVGGSWLVDPVDLTIDSSAATTIQTSLNGGTNVTESTDASSSSGFGTTASGNGDINVASGISWNSAASLTLSAYRNINVQDGVTIANAGAGGLTLHADNAATGTGTVNFNGTGQQVNFTGSGNIDLFYHPATYAPAAPYTGRVTTGTGAFTPYMTVDTATDLQQINSNIAGTYALNTDIDASSISTFVPIAHSTIGADTTDNSKGFSGIFDGQSHTIKNLTINDAGQTTGLFAQTSSTGIIRNVGLANISVNNTNSNYQVTVGGLVGENYGTISSSYVAGSVKSTGGIGGFIGGLAGGNDGRISDTYSSASVSATSCDFCTTIGGLVGINGYFQPSASIATSLAMGSVSVTGDPDAYIGGFAGENDTNISSSYFDKQSTGQSVGGGFCGSSCTGITGQTTTQLQSGSLPTNFSPSIWTASAGAYPKLAWQVPPPPPGLSVSGIVYNGITPLPSVTVIGLANGTPFGPATTDVSGAYTLTAPVGTTSVLTYLTGVNKGNTFSDKLTTSFAGVDIYTNTLRLINTTNNNYSAMISALSTALGSNSGSNFLFSISSGNAILGSGANFALISSVPTTIDQSIAGNGTVLVQSSGNLTISASKTISATGTGTPLTLVTSGNFINNGGVNALSTGGGGRWLVYSQNPANDTVGSLSYGFKQYAAGYGSATVAQSTGNGLLYASPATLTPSLTGSTSKTYDATATATITAANLTSTGALTGDTITLSATGAAYADKNQGSSKSVTATGVSATATDSTGATVYGYQLSSTSASGNIGTINPATLTYTANTASRTYGAANPAFSGTVTGFVGGDTQASATTGALSFTSSAISVNNVGNYAINGTGLTANNGNYTFQQAAANATALTINPALLSYTANTASRTYGGINPAFSGSVTGFVNGDTQASSTTGTLSFTSPASTANSVGSYAINGSGLTANSNYTLQQAAGNATALTINPAPLTYTADTASRSYGAANPAFSGSVTGFVNGETLASATTGTLLFTSAAIPASNVGNYAINGSGLTANNGNYTFQQAAGNATALTINPALLTYTANAASRTYGAANPALSGTVTGFVNGNTQATATTGTLSFTTSATTASNVSNYAINGTGLTANNGNYTFQQAGANATALTINPALLSYTANTASRTYGGINPAFSGSVTGFVNGDTEVTATTGTLSFTSPATATSNVGNYAVNGAGLTANNGNYTFEQAAGNSTAFTINPALLTYTADSASRSYGGADPAFTGTVTGFVNSDTLASATTGALAFTSPATTASNVGNYAVNGSGLAANNGNYTFQQAVGNATALTINPAQLLYTANTVSRTYGDANPALNGTVTGFVNGDTQGTATTGTLSFTSSATSTSNVGSYAINGSGLTAVGGNYTLAQAAGSATALTINPALLTYTAYAASRTYGAANPSFSGSVTGFVNGETQATATTGTLAFTTPATSATNVGSYAINGSGLTANSNYTLQQAAGNATALTINPALLTYTANAASRSYGAANSAFSGSLTGFVNGDTKSSATAGTLAFTSPATSTSNVGNYAVNGSGLTANNGNYTFQQAAGNGTALTINPAQLLYTANSVSRTYGGTNPTFTGTVTGFVNGDTQASATTGTLGFSTTAAKTTGVGNYAINGSGLTANSNYTLAQASGNATALTINPAQLTASVLAKDKVYDATTAAFGQVAHLSGVLNGDDVSINDANAAFRFNDKNVGNAKTVTETGAALSGGGASNYTLTVTPGTANITPATVVAAVSANDKLYDTTAEASGHIGTLSGVLGNDDVQADSSQAVYAFSDKNAGTNKSVAATGVALTGADAGNYILALANGSAAITPATVAASVAANSKTYDGTLATTGSLGSLTGVLGKDSVTLNSANASYSFLNPNSGTGKAVTATGITLAGPDAANYRLSIQNGLANINPVPVTVSIANADRLVGAPNPAFAAVYKGGQVPGVSIPDLLSSISFSVNATTASGPGTYTVSGASAYPNVDLTVLPGTLTINFAATPKTDPSMAAAKRIDPPPLSAPALSNNILPPSSLGLLQVSYSTSWSSLGNAASVSQPLASSSFLTSGASSATYQGGIRPW